MLGDGEQSVVESAEDVQTVKTDGVLSLDDARTLVNESLQGVADGYYERERQAEEGLVSSVDALGKDVQLLVASAADAKGAEGDAQGDSSYVVVVDAEQWATAQRCWGFAKSGLQVALFLELVLVLVACAMLGSRLWSDFSRGWRR